jgi:hypothetical protein
MHASRALQGYWHTSPKNVPDSLTAVAVFLIAYSGLILTYVIPCYVWSFATRVGTFLTVTLRTAIATAVAIPQLWVGASEGRVDLMLNRSVDVACGSVDSLTLTSDLLQKCQSATSLSKSPFDKVCLRQSRVFLKQNLLICFHIALKKYWVFPAWFTRKCFYWEEKYNYLHENVEPVISGFRRPANKNSSFSPVGKEVTKCLVIEIGVERSVTSRYRNVLRVCSTVRS